MSRKKHMLVFTDGLELADGNWQVNSIGDQKKKKEQIYTVYYTVNKYNLMT